MNAAQGWRLAITLLGFGIALVFIFLTPFGGWTDFIAGAVALLAGSLLGDRVFRKMTSHAEKAEDMRDRVDNAP